VGQQRSSVLVCLSGAEVPLEPVPDDDEEWLVDDEEIEAASPQEPAAAWLEATHDAQRAQWEAEAAANGYGKLYAAFGGGKEGLEACAAGRPCSYFKNNCLH
jgi:hypothetical protein